MEASTPQVGASASEPEHQSLWDQLPADLFQCIFKRLAYHDLVRAGRVSRAWQVGSREPLRRCELVTSNMRRGLPAAQYDGVYSPVDVLDSQRVGAFWRDRRSWGAVMVQSVRCTDVGTGYRRFNDVEPGRGLGINFCRDHQRVFTRGSDGRVQVLSAASGAHLGSAEHEKPVAYAALSDDGRLLATSDVGYNLSIMDTETWVERDITPRREVTGQVFNHNENRFFIFNLSGTRLTTRWYCGARVYDTSNGALLSEHIGPYGSTAVVSGDGERVAHESGTYTVDVVSTNDGSRVSFPVPTDRLQIDTQWRLDTFSPDGRLLVINDRSGSMLCDATTGKQMLKIKCDRLIGGNATFSYDGEKILFTGVGHASLTHRHAGWPTVLLANRQFTLSCAEFSSDSSRLVSGWYSGDLILHNADTGRRMAWKRFPTRVEQVHFSPDSSKIAVCVEPEEYHYQKLSTIHILDALRGEVLTSLRSGYGYPYRSFAFNAGSTQLAVRQSNDRAQIMNWGPLDEVDPSIQLWTPTGSIAVSKQLVQGLEEETKRLQKEREAAARRRDREMDELIAQVFR